MLIPGVIASSIYKATGGQSGTYEARVSASTDDGNEAASGVVQTTSTIFYFYDSASQYQSLAIFRNVDVPQNATIDVAYITVVAQATSGTPTTAPTVISVQQSSNPAAITATQYNISSRSYYGTTVAWDIPAFFVNSSYTTPSLVSLIQYIVNRSDWYSGGGIAINSNGQEYTGGTRRAKSYNYDPALAPLLHIEWHT